MHRHAATRLPARHSTLSPILVLALLVLNAVGPLATDMYIPAFPEVAHAFDAPTTQVQLTLTTFFLGMGVGQLIGGPISDRVGRRRPILIGTVLVLTASLACALAPTIGVLMVARFVQGFGGGWAIVIGKAVLVDLAHGPRLVRIMNLLMAVGGLAPIVAPLIGAAVLQVTDWHGAFWVLALCGLVMTGFALTVIPESLPPSRRTGGGLTRLRRSALEVVGNRYFMGYVVVNAFSMVALFSYVSTSSFILQSMNGLSAGQYAADFATNATAMMLGSFISARLAGRVATRKVIAAGLTAAMIAGVTMLVGSAFFGAPLAVTLVAFFVLMAAQGFIFGNSGALAAAQVPQHAGTAGAVIGVATSLGASLTAPIAGLGGTTSAVPVGIMMVTGTAISLFGLLRLARPAAPDRPTDPAGNLDEPEPAKSANPRQAPSPRRPVPTS